jgi:hypothetical protein
MDKKPDFVGDIARYAAGLCRFRDAERSCLDLALIKVALAAAMS